MTAIRDRLRIGAPSHWQGISTPTSAGSSTRKAQPAERSLHHLPLTAAGTPLSQDAQWLCNAAGLAVALIIGDVPIAAILVPSRGSPSSEGAGGRVGGHPGLGRPVEASQRSMADRRADRPGANREDARMNRSDGRQDCWGWRWRSGWRARPWRTRPRRARRPLHRGPATGPARQPAKLPGGRPAAGLDRAVQPGAEVRSAGRRVRPRAAVRNRRPGSGRLLAAGQDPRQRAAQHRGGPAGLKYLAASGDPVATRIRQQLTVIVIPMYNPDGAEANIRQSTTPLQIDLNRDWELFRQPESRAWYALEQTHPGSPWTCTTWARARSWRGPTSSTPSRSVPARSTQAG